MFNAFFGFNGRINRQGWWLGQVALAIVAMSWLFGPFAMGMPSVMVISQDGVMGGDTATSPLWTEAGLGIFAALYSWIFLSVTTRRFHDLGYSGMWALIGFVPTALGAWVTYGCPLCSGDPLMYQLVFVAGVINYAVGPILLSVCGMRPGEPDENQYGPPPGSPASLPQEIGPAPGSGLGKIDDDYLRRYAAQQASTPHSTVQPASSFKGGVTPAGPTTFGRR